MTLGKYVNGNSLVHRLDPRNKFIILMALMVAVFMINPSLENYEIFGWVCYVFLTIFLLVLYKVAKLKISMIFSSLKPMWFMMVFLLVVNFFVFKGGAQVIPQWWIFDIHVEAFTQTLKIVFRLALLITLSTLFTATTKPLDITVAIDDLFAWLKIFHINVSILSMMISLALRFIPTILEETYKIMKAQSSRGVDFQNGTMKEKVVAITSLIIPLFISSITRSDELANAMEARNYNPLATRTRYRKLKWMVSDTVSLIVCLSILVFGIVMLIFFNNNVLGTILTDSWIKSLFNL